MVEEGAATVVVDDLTSWPSIDLARFSFDVSSDADAAAAAAAAVAGVPIVGAPHAFESMCGTISTSATVFPQIGHSAKRLPETVAVWLSARAPLLLLWLLNIDLRLPLLAADPPPPPFVDAPDLAEA